MVGEAEELVRFNEKIKEANISLILNGYEDIFSSFDPRGYSERALSDFYKNVNGLLEIRIKV